MPDSDSEVDGCNCMLKHDRDPSVAPCGDDGDGVTCTKPEGHTGPHSACSLTQHPIEVWQS